MTIGFIGLGRMGHGMASNLRKSGVDLIVYDVMPQAMVDFDHKANSLEELSQKCDLIFTSLPGPTQFEEVVFASGGVLENIKPGTTLFDLSTNSLNLMRKTKDLFEKNQCFFLDSPVSGGPAGALSGDLVLWIGGRKEIYERNLNILKLFSQNPRYVGEIGAGTVTKLAHNMMGYTIMLAEAEVFSMAVKSGVDPLDLWESLRFGFVGKRSPLDLLVNQFLPGDYKTPAFAMKFAYKDVMLATSLAKEAGVPMRLSSLTLDEMTEAMGQGYSEWDSRSFLQLQLQRAGVDIAVDPKRLQQAIELSKTI